MIKRILCSAIFMLVLLNPSITRGTSNDTDASRPAPAQAFIPRGQSFQCYLMEARVPESICNEIEARIGHSLSEEEVLNLMKNPTVKGVVDEPWFIRNRIKNAIWIYACHEVAGEEGQFVRDECDVRWGPGAHDPVKLRDFLSKLYERTERERIESEI